MPSGAYNILTVLNSGKKTLKKYFITSYFSLTLKGLSTIPNTKKKGLAPLTGESASLAKYHLLPIAALLA